MRISDLSYLEDISELPSVTGGTDFGADAALNSAYFPVGYGGFSFTRDVSTNTFSSPQTVFESSASGASVVVAATPGSSAHAYARSGNTSVEATI